LNQSTDLENLSKMPTEMSPLMKECRCLRLRGCLPRCARFRAWINHDDQPGILTSRRADQDKKNLKMPEIHRSDKYIRAAG
jgi:hypothetical protein